MACETVGSLHLPEDRFWRLAFVSFAMYLGSKHVPGKLTGFKKSRFRRSLICLYLFSNTTECIKIATAGQAKEI